MMKMLIEGLRVIQGKGFFKESEVAQNGNVVSFLNEAYSVEINTDSKEVSITRSKDLEMPNVPDLDSDLYSASELAEYQSQLKTGINYKEFKEIYITYSTGKKPNLFSVRKVTNEQVDEFIAKAHEYAKKYDEEFSSFRTKMGIYSSDYLANAKFLYSINDEINFLQEKGYKITTTLSSKFYKEFIEVLNSNK